MQNYKESIILVIIVLLSAILLKGYWNIRIGEDHMCPYGTRAIYEASSHSVYCR